MSGVQEAGGAPPPSAPCTDGEMCCSDMQRALPAIGRGSVSALMSDSGCGGQDGEESLPPEFQVATQGFDRNAAASSSAFHLPSLAMCQ